MNENILLKKSEYFDYLQYLPLEYNNNNDESYALLIYLHGAGESGNNAWDIISEGSIGTPITEIYYKRGKSPLTNKFIIICPQTNHGWHTNELINFTKYLINDSKLKIDIERVYVTGVSMGGNGVWSIANVPNLYAAIVPICPAGRPKSIPISIKHVRIYHGINDIVVPSRVSDNVFAELKEKQPKLDVTYIKIPNAPAPVGWPRYIGHAAWIPAYNSDVFEWLLKHKLN